MEPGQDIYVEEDGTKVIEFGFTYQEKARGWVKRAFHPVKKHFEFRDSYFDDALPRWMQHGEKPLVEGKGTPTIAYMDMFCMKRLGVGYGELQTAKICAVHDFESALQLEWLQRKLEDKSLSELVTHTRIYHSRQTPIVVSGHQIVSADIQDGNREVINDFLSPQEKYKYRDLFSKYGIERASSILWRFEINLQLEPYV